MEHEIRGRPGKYLKRNEDGTEFKKVPDMQDMLDVRLKNSKTYIDLPFRYIMDATKTAETVEDAEEDLVEQQQRVRAAQDRDQGHRRGDRTIYVERARDDGPPNWQPAVDEMNKRLNASEDARRQADDKRLQDELAAAQIAAQRHAEQQRLVAEATANMQSHAHENRLMREAMSKPPAVPDPTHHLREAEAHIQRQAGENQYLRGALEGQQSQIAQANLAQSAQNQGMAAFIAQNQADIAQLAGQLGNGIQNAFGMFMNGMSHAPPPQPQVIQVLSGGGPPPPPPSGARIRKAAAAIKDVKLPKTQEVPASRPMQHGGSSGSNNPPGGPPPPGGGRGGGDPRGGPYGDRPPPKPPPSQGGGIFGPPISAEEKKKKDELNRAKWSARYEDAQPAPSVAQAKAKAMVKSKFQRPAGTVSEKVVDHAKELTKKGKKPQLAGYVPGTEPGPAPHVPEASQLTYKGVALDNRRAKRNEVLAKRPMTGTTKLAGAKRKATGGDHPETPHPKKGARREAPRPAPQPAPQPPPRQPPRQPALPRRQVPAGPNFRPTGYPAPRRVTATAV